MVLVNFKTYPQGTGEKAVELAGICQKVADQTKVEVIPVVQVVDLWRVKQEFPQLPIFVQHIDFHPPGKFTGRINLEAVVEAGASGTLLNHSEYPLPPGTIKKVQSSKFNPSTTLGIDGERSRTIKVQSDNSKFKNFQIIVCCKTLGQAQRLVKLKPDFLAYELPELIGAKQASVATVHPKTIDKVVKVGKSRGVPVIVGAGIHSAQDVKISLKKGAVGILVATDVVLAKEPEKELRELVGAFS